MLIPVQFPKMFGIKKIIDELFVLIEQTKGKKMVDELFFLIEQIKIREESESLTEERDLSTLTLVELINRFEVSTRLRNAINGVAKQNLLPFATVGELWNVDEETAKQKLAKIPNIGKKTIDELLVLIEQIKTRKLGIPLPPPSIASMSLLEFVNKVHASIRLKNIITVAAAENKLPFATIGEMLLAGDDAKQKLLEIKNFGKTTLEEILNLLKQSSIVLRHTKNLQLADELDQKYPGVFDPLLDAYKSIEDTDIKGYLKLEKLIRKLITNEKDHADMVALRFFGETLESIGESYNMTRERIRQITSQYDEYITDINSENWIFKAIDQLVASQPDTPKRLPSNEELVKFHPQLPHILRRKILGLEYGVAKLNSFQRSQLAEYFGFDVDYENEGLQKKRWTLDRVITEIRKTAVELGKPDLMPKQEELVELRRQDLRGAIGKFGGQSKVAELAGLKYQGQLVSPDGGRQYWTNERIEEFLCEVAEKEGHPGVMPTPGECRKHAPNPATVITNITGAGSPKKKPLSWYEVALKHGFRYTKKTQQVTLNFVKSFVKSLGDALYTLTPAEIYVLFEQQGIAKNYQKRTFDNIVGAIQSGYLPKEEIDHWLQGQPDELVETLLDPEIESVAEAYAKVGRKLTKANHKKKNDNLSDKIYREEVEAQLPTPTAGETLDSLKIASEVLINSSSDAEAIQFLIAKAADKLWKRCFQDEPAALAEAQTHQGNVYSESVRDKFIEDYENCKKLPLPAGYAFKDAVGIFREPKLMQRLIAYRVLKEERVLNLSGTGTGKTLSAVLASRVIGAQMTIIACPNSTVDGWKKTILSAFPDSDVVIKPENWRPVWNNTNKPRYLVVNHEMFQNLNQYAIKRFIQEYCINFVVIDELHRVKQRDHESETQRRRLLNGIITDVPENRPKPKVLGMSATPVINNLHEGKSLIELVSSVRHDDIGSKTTVQNCMKVFQKFTTMGFRMMPKLRQDRTPQIHPIDCSFYLEELLNLSHAPHPQRVEAILVKARWPIILKCLRPKTVVFTEYVTDIVPYLVNQIKQAGFSVGIHTGDERLATEIGYDNILEQFIRGELQILVASIKTLGTGIDGLQYVCNNVIFATLPWTSTDYEQAIGRFDREGFIFDKLDIHIPKTYAVLNSGEEWSWCDSKLFRLENKRNIARATVDGEIPDSSDQLTPAKATSYWMGWLKRLTEEGLSTIERTEIKVPLDESDATEVSRRYAQYGDFSRLNARWNQAHSATTHQRLTENPEEWCFYHTRMQELEIAWEVIPREECLKHILENLPENSIIGDFGCGQAQLADVLLDLHTVYSFDHIAVNDNVIACDMAHVPLDDNSLDAVIFSLSLMGTNLKDYILEAYRVLQPGGQLLIYHPAEHHDRQKFVKGLEQLGFAIVQHEQIYKWHSIWAIKRGRQSNVEVEISF